MDMSTLEELNALKEYLISDINRMIAQLYGDNNIFPVNNSIGSFQLMTIHKRLRWELQERQNNNSQDNIRR